MVRDVESITPLKLVSANNLPDYRDEMPGGSKGGRLLAPDPLDMAQVLLDAEKVHAPIAKIRQSPFPLYSAVPLPTNDPRFYVAGRALIGGLLLGCIQRGIEVMDSTPARHLLLENGRIIGVRAERGGKDFFIRARKGVLLATGGYEWNEDLNRRYMRVPEVHGITPPSNSGDGHIMGMEVGGGTALMDLSLFMPTIRIPGEEIDGVPMYRIFQFWVGQPGNILVNKKGKRCCDEAFYPDIGRAFEEMDAQRLEHANLPMYWIVDQGYRDWMTVGTLPRGTDMADWLQRGETLEELGAKLGIPGDSLAQSVDRFNTYAKEGLDPDFHRGDSAYDRRWGFRPKHKPNPALGPLDKPPFYGLRLHIGTVGNLGGLITNQNAQVLDVNGQVIPGLYATSNTAAALHFGAAYTSGMVGGKAMTFGWLAARHAAGISASPETAPDQKQTRVFASAAVDTQPASREAAASETATGQPSVQILNEDGTSLLGLESVQKVGDRLRMQGKLMGSFATKMYLDAGGLFRLLGMMLGKAPLLFILLSPWYWIASYRKTTQDHGLKKAARVALAGGLALVVYAVLIFIVTMIVLGISNLAS